MKKFNYLAIMAAFLSTGLSAQAVLPEVSKAFSDVGLNVKAVADSTVPGMLQVQTDKGLFFMSENKQYLFEGNIYDLKSKKLVNEEILKDVRKAGIKEFQGSTIEFKAENEKYVINVFTDTSCGYCRKLHNEMADLNKAGITVRYLAFPRGGLQSATYDELQSIWCAKDAKQAMTDAKSGKAVKQTSCKNNVVQQYELGQSFGITGTPALILPDGRLVPGYKPVASLLEELSQITL